MMTMKSIWNERSRLKPAGSTVRRYAKAQITPATPMMKDEIAKASSLVRSTGNADDARGGLVVAHGDEVATGLRRHEAVR